MSTLLRIDKSGAMTFGRHRGHHVIDVFNRRDQDGYFQWCCAHVKGFREGVIFWLKHAFFRKESEANLDLPMIEQLSDQALRAECARKFPEFLAKVAPPFCPAASITTPQALAAKAAQPPEMSAAEPQKKRLILTPSALEKGVKLFEKEWEIGRVHEDQDIHSWLVQESSDALDSGVKDHLQRYVSENMIVTMKVGQREIMVVDFSKPSGTQIPDEIWF